MKSNGYKIIIRKNRIPIYAGYDFQNFFRNEKGQLEVSFENSEHEIFDLTDEIDFCVMPYQVINATFEKKKE